MSSSFYRIVEHIVPCQHIRQYPGATRGDCTLQLAVKQYIPKDNEAPEPGDVTIIAGQAIGAPKEQYEPMWDGLWKYSKRTGAFRVRAIWFADCVSHGASGVLNEGKLGNDRTLPTYPRMSESYSKERTLTANAVGRAASWLDYARDLLGMINCFRDQIVQPIIGVGHSMGGTVIADVALMHPRLFSSVVLIEPMLQELQTGGSIGIWAVAYGATFKKDVWPSREAAAAKFRRGKFYSSWDPRALDLFIQYGLRELPTALYPLREDTNDQQSSRKPPQISRPGESSKAEEVTLTTTRHQEAFNYARPAYPPRNESFSSFVPERDRYADLGTTRDHYNPEVPFYRPELHLTFERLPHLLPHCLYIQAAKSQLGTAGKRAALREVTGTGVGGSGGAMAGAVEEVVVPDVGHLLPFECPDGVADIVGHWLLKETNRNHGIRKGPINVQAQVPPVVDEDWEFWMKEWRKGTFSTAESGPRKRPGRL